MTTKVARHNGHAGLERDDVIDAALAIVETGGGQALTMRKLAAELGVAPTAIYWHVGNRDELVLGVIRRQAERQSAARVRGSNPRDRIVSAATNIRKYALAHRNVTALASQVGATTLLELPLEMAVVAELEAAGVVGPPARDALRSILACLAGFLIVEWRPEDSVPADLRPTALWGGMPDGVMTDETRRALADRPNLDDLFQTTLHAVVAGILAGAAPKGRTAR